MSLDVTAMILLAALMHAGWNAIIKVSGDRYASMGLMALSASLFSMLFLPIVDAPLLASWPLLGLTIALHCCYHFFLPLAYKHGDLGQVYPIVRGSAPLLVTLGAMLMAGESLPIIALLGVFSLTAGVLVLAFDKSDNMKRKPKAVLYALLTACIIGSYTLVDGFGARQAGSALGFAIWLNVGGGILTFGILVMFNRKGLWRVMCDRPVTIFCGGVMQGLTYCIIIWALSIAPMGMVSALRETSVLFAALLSTFVLKEGFGVWRFISAALVTGGVILVRGQK